MVKILLDLKLTEKSFCTCNKPKIIRTINPLPDICENCRKAILNSKIIEIL